MLEVTVPPFVLAMAQTGQSQSVLVSVAPFALMLLIVYFLVLAPMRKRQKKVQDFQAALKVGDKVITTGGIYGLVTKVNPQTVRVQIADKVQIEISRAAVGGYQGQEPVVQDQSAL
jgi:preprotein translocase subunit YajC